LLRGEFIKITGVFTLISSLFVFGLLLSSVPASAGTYFSNSGAAKTSCATRFWTYQGNVRHVGTGQTYGQYGSFFGGISSNNGPAGEYDCQGYICTLACYPISGWFRM
jgi:hypothetical protein